MDEAFEILHEVDRILELGEQGYALQTEVRLLESRTKNFLTENIDKETIFWRKFDVWMSVAKWRSIPPTKYEDPSNLGELRSLRDLLTKFIEEKNISLPPEQQWINAGHPYTAKRTLRERYLLADEKLDIQDSFMGIRFLNQLSICLEEKPHLKVRVLTKDGRHKDLTSFLNELPDFQKEFPNVEFRSYDQDHGRFFIVDGKRVFNPGASAKDLGSKGDHFTETTVQKAKKDVIDDFEKWWALATPGVKRI